jgi:hypothetical protein
MRKSARWRSSLRSSATARNLRQLQALPNRHLGFGVLNIAGDSVGELLQSMIHPWSAGAVLPSVLI